VKWRHKKMEELKTPQQEQTDFNKFLDEHEPVTKTLNITEAGKIMFADITNVDDKWTEYPQEDGTTKKAHSYTLTIKGQNYRCPTSVMDDLKEVRSSGKDKELGQLTGFIVTKKGTGINTTYTILPEFTK